MTVPFVLAGRPVTSGAAAPGAGAQPPPAGTGRGGAPPALRPTGSVLVAPGYYLCELDLVRVVTFVGVIAQHSILWTVSPTSAAGWALSMLLHFTRNTFFFLAALVAGYAALVRPRTPRQLWRRRITQVLTAYLCWTVIYVAYTLVTTPSSRAAPLGTLWHFLFTGYYQLYFVVVLLQFYVLLPLLLWLLRVTRKHHGAVLAGSLCLQVAMSLVSFDVTANTGPLHLAKGVVNTLLNSRSLTAYQLYVIGGLVLAAHVDELHAFVDRHARALLAVPVVTGAAALVVYLLEMARRGPGGASALNQPVDVLWFCGATLGLFTLGRLSARRWAQAHGGEPRALRWAADASGGFYFAHVLMLELTLQLITASGLRAEVSWARTSVLVFLGTLVGTGLLVGLLLRTRLATALTGPERAAQRRHRLDFGGLVADDPWPLRGSGPGCPGSPRRADAELLGARSFTQGRPHPAPLPPAAVAGAAAAVAGPATPLSNASRWERS